MTYKLQSLKENPLYSTRARGVVVLRQSDSYLRASSWLLKGLFPLQAKEAELLQINKILEDSDLTASKYRQWKEHHEELVQEIDRAAALKASKEGLDEASAQNTPAEEVAMETVAKETATTETEGAYRLSLSDGEQLVDAEPSDVLLEIAQGSLSAESSPVLELSLGSLQESINKQLSEMAESGEVSEGYFYI